MKEYFVRRFFEDEYGPADLEADFPGTVTEQNPGIAPRIRSVHFEPMTVKFTVEPRHIIKLIDATLAGQLQLETLETIADWLDANPHFNFTWDSDSPEGERISDSVFWLGTPEINYPLTPDVLTKIRHYLLTGEKLLTAVDTKRPKAGA